LTSLNIRYIFAILSINVLFYIFDIINFYVL
jgi:hypothetical protein